jgi:hypothetical protein
MTERSMRIPWENSRAMVRDRAGEEAFRGIFSGLPPFCPGQRPAKIAEYSILFFARMS